VLAASANAEELSATVPTAYQLPPESVEYSQAPSVEAFAVLPMTATPPMLLPESTSTKAEPSKADSVAPAGFAVSSFTAASVAPALKDGASFTLVIEVLIVAVLALIAVALPLLEVLTVTRVAPLVKPAT
jgi:hypothetical protein